MAKRRRLVITPEPIQRLLAEHLAGRVDHGTRLWLLVNAELWHRLHVENTPVDELRGQVSEALDGDTPVHQGIETALGSEPTGRDEPVTRAVGVVS